MTPEFIAFATFAVAIVYGLCVAVSINRLE
jgi:hypothetical protein